MMKDAGELPSSEDSLEARSDEELVAMIVRAQTILEQREQEHRKRALEQIQDLARAAGLTVNVTKKPRRGRPPRKQKDSA
jgi:nucleotide-binding universal stress UspA family protein